MRANCTSLQHIFPIPPTERIYITQPINICYLIHSRSIFTDYSHIKSAAVGEQSRQKGENRKQKLLALFLALAKKQCVAKNFILNFHANIHTSPVTTTHFSREDPNLLENPK